MVQVLGGFGGRFAMNQKFNNAMLGNDDSLPSPFRRPRLQM